MLDIILELETYLDPCQKKKAIDFQAFMFQSQDFSAKIEYYASFILGRGHFLFIFIDILGLSGRCICLHFFFFSTKYLFVEESFSQLESAIIWI